MKKTEAREESPRLTSWWEAFRLASGRPSLVFFLRPPAGPKSRWRSAGSDPFRSLIWFRPQGVPVPRAANLQVGGSLLSPPSSVSHNALGAAGGQTF